LNGDDDHNHDHGAADRDGDQRSSLLDHLHVDNTSVSVDYLSSRLSMNPLDNLFLRGSDAGRHYIGAPHALAAHFARPTHAPAKVAL
jgi:hypothetical protein